jgi:stage V sporulation protein SpoVS
MADDFTKMDAEAGVEVMDPVPAGGHVMPPVSNDVMTYRNQLVQQYHGGQGGIVEALESEGRGDTESLLEALIREVIKETDHLLGNELVAAANGDLRDSSVISYKRAEALEKAIKAIAAKRALEKESGIDLDSPSMQVIFRFFMTKVNDTLVKMSVADEMKDIFFATIGDEMDGWKKELKEKFKELRTGR